MDTINLEVLQSAVAGPAAAFRARTRLQPAGGEGDKVFPPTYAGAVYAVEERRTKQENGEWETTPCVLLDSVQSQANRLEEALQQAIDAGLFQDCPIPVIEVDFSGEDLLDEVGTITSLTAPHRAADAILRDSLVAEGEGQGTPFRESPIGARLDHTSRSNATPLYEICPTALVFGIWDSTGLKGGLGAKFQRSLVSEIVGVNVSFGKKTSSRIDPLKIQRVAGPVYRTVNRGWTLDASKALQEKGKPVLYGKRKGKNITHDPKNATFPDEGRPSVINHGNVTPDFSRYTGSIGVPDPIRPHEEVREKRVGASGVTVDYAEQTTVLSLPALRRLRFPVNGGSPTQETDAAGRTVLAALGLTACALAAENGYDLRSRCLLWPSNPLRWELLARPGEKPAQLTFTADDAIQTLKEAIAAAEKVGLTWRKDPLKLTPAPQLVELLKRSQKIAADESTEETEV